MPLIPGAMGPAYRLQSPNVSCDRSINLVTEVIEQGPRQGQLRMKQIPGLRLYATIPGGGPIRGIFSNEFACWVVSGGQLWQIFQNNAPLPQLQGNVANGTNPAIFAKSGPQLMIASAGLAFINTGPGVVTPVHDNTGQPVQAATIAFMDQYFIAGIQNTNLVQISNLADGNIWDPADVAAKEAYSDNIIRVWVDQPGGEYLWLFGSDTIEVWTDTGGLFPFQRIQSMVFSIGCDSAWSVAGIAGQRFWTWRGRVYMASGFQPQRISDYGVEYAISTYSRDDQLNSEGFAWVEGGHTFYAISYPTAGRTWVYDASINMWHERLYYSNGQYGRYRPRVLANAFGETLVGDYLNGNIYAMDPNVYTDALGAPLRRQRIFPYITDQEKNQRYNRLTVDIDTGVGLSVPSNQLGYDPQLIMRYSWDRGKNWSNEQQQPIGKIGADDTRFFFPQLSSSRIGMTFELTITDPVPSYFNAAYIDISAGTLASRP
jgi:hypothetical protein